jgi:NAD(P)-dependent dehydrogenase (short-subunit alcohol dehydrogenase family)
MAEPILASMRLDGQRALVTGAGRGIGRGCALALAEAGAEAIAVARTGPELDSLKAEIEAGGGRCEVRVVDVTDSSAVRRLFDGLGRLDVLVNNAGTAVPGPFLEMTEAALDLMLDLNCRAASLVAQAGARSMAAQRSGVIVNLSSTYGKVGRTGNAVYAATKHYVEGLNKSLALELAPMGVRVVAVGPTIVDTPLTHDRLHDPVYGAQMLERIPLGRAGLPADVAAAVVFLASPAASLITGTTLMIDGGWTAQ